MATSCVNTSTVEFLTLLQKSGLPSLVLLAYVTSFLDNYDRMPYLDELPTSNSLDFLNLALKISKFGGTKKDLLFEYTKTNDITEALIKLNNEFRDLDISVIDLGEEVAIDIKHRPSKFNSTSTELNTDINKETLNVESILKRIVLDLQIKHGIQVIPTNSEVAQNQFKIENIGITKGFIYEGNIYLNTDNVTSDTVIHELFHLLMGGIKSLNPEVYLLLMGIVSSINWDTDIIKNYPNRTQSDVIEEILVTEIAKYLTNLDTKIKKLPLDIQHELIYNINRMIDSIFMGETSVNDVAHPYSLSLTDLAYKLNSRVFNQSAAESATEHRVLNNLKSDLLKKGLLKEYCG